jgi:hypothetical protein
MVTTIFAFIFWIASLHTAAAAPVQPAAQVVVRTTVAGVTVRSDASEPVTFVTLKLVPLDNPGTPSPTGRGGASPSGNLQVTSDAIGQFQFNGVLPGRYAISAEREGYVPVDQFLPGLRQSAQSILTITAGSKVDGLVVTMTPVPTISGTVYNPLGQRLAGVTVSAYRVQYTPYGRQLVRIASVLSHERGEYRLFRLAPGYYYVSASYSDRALRPWKSLLELSPNLTSLDDGYSTVYYPGEMQVANAKVVNLYNGAVVNADIGFKETRYFRLSVKVLLPAPKEKVPPLRNTKLAIFPVGTDLGSAQDFVVQGSGTSFSVDHLAEGEYVLAALADFRDDEGNTYSGIVSDTLPVRLIDNAEVTIAAMYPFVLPGTVTGPLNAANSGGAKIQLVRVDPWANQTFTANVPANGQFTFLGVGPGTYDVFVQGMPRNAYLQQAGFSYADRRLSQIRIDANLPPRSVHDDTQLLTSDALLMASINIGGLALSGRVVDDKGGAVAGTEIVLVPTDPALRFRRDRYGITYSDASGAFQLSGIIPGSYTAYAFERIEPDIYFDSEFNAQISSKGTLVNVGSGLNRPLDRPLTVITKDDLLRLTR